MYDLDYFIIPTLIGGFVFYLFTKPLFRKERISVRLLSDDASLPCKKTDGAAGYDISASNNGYVYKNSKTVIGTGVVIEIPKGYYGRIAPRSGLAMRHNLDVLAGVIDSDYRGEIKIMLFNHSDKDFEYSTGDRIAQLIIEKIGDFDLHENYVVNYTLRGERAFGSTGVSNYNVINYYNANTAYPKETYEEEEDDLEEELSETSSEEDICETEDEQSSEEEEKVEAKGFISIFS